MQPVNNNVDKLIQMKYLSLFIFADEERAINPSCANHLLLPHSLRTTK